MTFHIDNNSNNYKLIKDFLAVNLKVFHKQWRSAQQFWMVSQIYHHCFYIAACLRGTEGEKINPNLQTKTIFADAWIPVDVIREKLKYTKSSPLKKILWSISPPFLSIKFFQKLYIWKTSNFWLSFFPSSVDVIRYLEIIKWLNIAITCLF